MRTRGCGEAVGLGRLSMDYISEQMRSSVIGGPFLYRREVASTNAEARSLAASWSTSRAPW